jgi:hypothetical protein
MAKSGYDHEAHVEAAQTRSTMTREEVFVNRHLDPKMDPKYKPFRECFRVPPYEEALPIVLGLDETGSMSTIPHFLVSDPVNGLPAMMKGLLPFVRHPQICPIGIGDARQRERERSPLQFGHFEGEGGKIDLWMTKIDLEGQGGGNYGESYELAIFGAARMVNADAFRDGDKGIFAMIADEPLFPDVRALDVNRLCGPEHHLQADIPTEVIVSELFEKYEGFMIAPDLGRFARVEENWRKYFGDNAIGASCQEDVAVLICGLTGLCKGTLTDLDVFDRLLMETFGRKDQRSRGRVISVLEAYAATRGLAGQARSPVQSGPPMGDRPSGNSRD